MEVRVFVMKKVWWMMSNNVIDNVNDMMKDMMMKCEWRERCDVGMLRDVRVAHEMWWWMMKRVWWRERNEERSEDVKELWGGGWGRMVWVTLQRDRILPQIRSSSTWNFSSLTWNFSSLIWKISPSTWKFSPSTWKFSPSIWNF